MQKKLSREGNKKMRTVTEIDADIAKVKAELENVHGTTTEVYARIVGYYRSVRNWNRGKREEYGHRKLFVADEGRIASRLAADSGCACDTAPSVMIRSATEAPSIMQAGEDALRESVAGPAFRYELFVRKTCPNCPPVKACCENLPVSGEQIDVDESSAVRTVELQMRVRTAYPLQDGQHHEVAGTTQVVITFGKVQERRYDPGVHLIVPGSRHEQMAITRQIFELSALDPDAAPTTPQVPEAQRTLALSSDRIEKRHERRVAEPDDPAVALVGRTQE